MPFYGNCNRSNRWLRNRIRSSRVAFTPKASIGETSAAAFITLSGMTLAEQRVVPSPGPPCASQPGGSGRLLCVDDAQAPACPRSLPVVILQQFFKLFL